MRLQNKSTALVALCSLLCGCSPALLKDPATGHVAQCSYSGAFPIINRSNCISEYEAKGWHRTTPEQEAIAQKKANEAKDKALAASDKCFSQLTTNPALQPISSKLALNRTDQTTLEMLANNDKVADNEHQAVSIYASERKKCTSLIDTKEFNESEPPSYAAIFHSYNNSFESGLAALYGGKITYGEFANFRKQLSSNYENSKIKLDEEMRRNAADAEARASQIAAQNAIAQSQVMQGFASMQNAFANTKAADAMMMNATNPLKYYQPVNPTPVLTPNPPLNYNQSVRCSSYYMGNTLHTNCN